MEHEGKYLEYKETVSRTYLKTVSAFANYGPGTIIFGITDDFQTVGVADPLRTALDIENQINDNIIPGPDYSLAIREDNTIALTVNKGKNTPYCYKTLPTVIKEKHIKETIPVQSWYRNTNIGICY